MSIAVYRYRVPDRPEWMTMIADADNCDLSEAKRTLALKFGARLVAVETQKSPLGAGCFGDLTQRIHMRYSVQVLATAGVGGSSPRLRRLSAATSRFFYARMIALLWAFRVGEPQGSPVPKPGLLTPRGLPTMFSSMVRQGIA